MRSGAGEGTRTPDPIITNDVLYQLSYSGTFLVWPLLWRCNSLVNPRNQAAAGGTCRQGNTWGKVVAVVVPLGCGLTARVSLEKLCVIDRMVDPIAGRWWGQWRFRLGGFGCLRAFADDKRQQVCG